MDYLDREGEHETDSSPSADAKAQRSSYVLAVWYKARGLMCIKLLTGGGEKWFACSAKSFDG